MQGRRASESEAQRQQRLEAKRVAEAERRAAESEEQRQQRLEADRIAQAEQRAI